MKGLMRMLMMFGPMIFRMFQKFQRKRSNQQSSGQINSEQSVDEHQNNKKG